MTARGRCSQALGLVALLALGGVSVACDDNGTEPQIDEAFVGNWFSTSFLVAGEELVTPAGEFSVSLGFFADSSYQLIVNGDVTGFLCDGVASCVESGDFSYGGGVITLDPGTADALALQFSVSGNTLSVSGTWDGVVFSGTFERI